MEYVRLGTTGLKVSRLCLGMTSGTSKWRPWVLDEAESRPFLEPDELAFLEDPCGPHRVLGHH